MRFNGSGVAGRAPYARLAAAGALSALVALAGCGTSSPTPASTVVGQFMRGTTQEPTTLDADVIAAAVSCPIVKLQPDTEFIRRAVEGAEGDSGLRWQASILRTARECSRAGEGVKIRVGLSGRVVEGPRGAPDTVELPVRIAVREGGEVTYSRLHSVSVTRTGASDAWAFVDEDVIVDDPDGTTIVVGFDG